MSFVLLIISFLCSGLSAVTNKALVEWNLADYQSTYLIALYATAAIMGVFLTLITKQKHTRQDVGVGSLMGIFGAIGFMFFMAVLKVLPGIVAFPVRNLGNLVVTAIVSIVAWREKLSKYQWLGIIISLIAIWLISG